MKKLYFNLAFIACLLTWQNLFSQLQIDNNCTTAFEDISATGLSNAVTDDSEFNFTLPFNFVLDGVSSPDLRIGTNGGILFGVTTGNVGTGNVTLPGFYPFGDDLDIQTNDIIYTEVLGTAPNRRAIIQWDNVCHNNYTTGGITFQVVLYETTNEITFVYDDIVFGSATYDNGVSAYVHVESAVGSYSYSSLSSIAGLTCLNFSVPSCVFSTNAIVSNLNSTTADVSWTPGGGSEWYVEFGPAGFTQGTGTLYNVTTNADTSLVGLLPFTDYDWYVRDFCTVGDTSTWFGPNSFTTLCSSFTAPYNYDVETATNTTNSTIGECWSSNPSGTTASYRWNVDGLGSTPSSPTGPTNGANSGSKYFYVEASSGGNGDTAELYTPLIDISSLTVPQLSFYYHMFGSTMGDLYVDVYDGTTWNNNVFSLIGEQQTLGTDDWFEALVDLSAYASSSVIQVRFTAVRSTNYYGDISLDDISFRETPSCPRTLTLNVRDFGSDTVDISWTTGGASSWVVEYGTTNFVQGTGNVLTLTTDTFTTISGLAGNTEYDVYIRDLCSPSDSSLWLGPVTFKTLCSFYAAPYLYDVESASTTTNSTIEDCWSSNPTGTTANYRWNVDGVGSTPSSPTGPTNGANSGSNYFYVEASSGTNGDTAELYSPLIDISSLTRPELKFQYHMFGATMGDLYVDIYDGSTWNNNVFSLLGQQQTDGSDAWIEAFVDLSAFTANPLIQVRFTAVRSTDYYGDISIDDIEIYDAPTCRIPFLLNASNLTKNSAFLNWVHNGTAIEWEIEYVPAGTAPTGVADVTNVLDTFHNLSGLSSFTDYDFYVRAVCSPGDTSAWSLSQTFTTLPDYCAGDLFYDNGGASANYNANTLDTIVICADNPGDIVTVTFNSFNTQENYDGLLIYNGADVNAPLIPSGDLATFSATTCPVNAWSGSGTYALTGANATHTSTDVSGCLTFVFGSNGFTQNAGWDASVTCAPRPASDIEVSEVINLVDFSCGVAQTVVELEIINQGAATQYNVPVTVEITGDFTQTFNTTLDSIQSLQTLNFVVDSFSTLSGGVANIVAYSNAPGDADLSNDTTYLDITFNEQVLEPITMNVNVCNYEDSFDLQATLVNGSVLTWFDVDTNELSNDSIYTIQNTGVNATYFVSATNTVFENFGPIDNTIGGGGNYTSYGDGLVFDVTSTFILNSVDVYTNGAGDVIVNIEDNNGATIYTQTFTVANAGLNTLTLNATIPPGTDYEMNATGTNAGLYRNTAGGVYPYSNSVVSITGPINNLAGYYYFFYNWSVSTVGCTSDLVQVDVNVLPSYQNTEYLAVCDEFTYSGNTVTTSGIYVDSLLTAGGCDSVITYNLTFSYSSSFNQLVRLCGADTLTIGNNEYFTSGTYVDTLTLANGCDSIVTTELLVSNLADSVYIYGLSPQICSNVGAINVDFNPLGGILSGNGVTSNYFDPALAGVGTHTLTYEFMDSVGCIASASADVEVIVCTNINEIDGIETLNIFPNPFIKSFNLNFVDAQYGEITLKLYDVLGQLIVSETFNTQMGVNNIEIQVPANIASGVHVMQIERDGQTFTKQLMKK